MSSDVQADDKAPALKVHPALKHVWRAAHIGVLVFAVIFILCFIVFKAGSLVGQIAYRGLFLSATIVYALSLFQRFQGQIPSFYVLLRMDSFQYGALAFFWLFTKWHLIKIFPFVFFSGMHVAGYVADELKPNTKISDDIHKLVDEHGSTLYKYTAWCNLVILVRLFLDCLTLRHGSTVSLLVFGLFYRIRVAYSSVTQEVLKELLSHIDTLANNPKVPAKVKGYWSQIKEALENYEPTSLDPKAAREHIARIKVLREKEAREEKIAEEKFEKEHYK